ncbi:MAG: hypothetical protein U1E22_06170 [Coriobacteriia bacterium]|nr:hypothetical protein [Coriobacteriia bacterium]
MMRMALGTLLLLHGLIHLGWAAPRPEDPSYPFDTTRSRLMPWVPAPVLKHLGLELPIVTALAFTAAALGLFGAPWFADVWEIAAIAGAVTSLIACALWWHPWFVAGPLLDIWIVTAIYYHWPNLG